MLHGRNCPGNHLHHPIKGNVKGKDHKWVRLSAYAAAYTAVFARRVAQAVLYINQGSEKPLLFEELLVGGRHRNSRGCTKEATGTKHFRAAEVSKTARWQRTPNRGRQSCTCGM